jgi:hypothetical protein
MFVKRFYTEGGNISSYNIFNKIQNYETQKEPRF